MTQIQLTIEAIAELARAALGRSGASADAADAVATSVAAAERDGIASHGLSYVPTYCEHLACGKVNKDASPSLAVTGNIVRVDADCGFAHPAIALGFARMAPLAQSAGVAALSVFNSYNAGVLGYHTERLAAHGLVALGFTNSPASIAPWGSRKPLFGTNPWSLAVPGRDGEAAFVIDQSASVIAKSEVMKYRREGRALPPGWALDGEGRPTVDPEAALAGTMVPAGGYKGVGSALLVEVFAACLSGATLGMAASPFSGTTGGPPRTGQFFVAIAPAGPSGGLFGERTEELLAGFAAIDGARLPGERRRAARRRHADAPVGVPIALYEKVRGLAGG